MPDIKLFAGNATPELAKRIAERLYISLGDATVGRFSDGEIQVQINEKCTWFRCIYRAIDLCTNDDNLMELIVMVDALRRASAGRITAVIPYFWLCSPRPPCAFSSCANYSKSCSRFPFKCGRGSCFNLRPSRRTNPRFL